MPYFADAFWSVVVKIVFASVKLGKIVMPKTEIPEMGWFAVALDPEGNGFGIFESKDM